MAIPVNMLWIGGQLGYVERLSMQSFIDHGHEVRLHLYDEVPDLPAGVVVVDGGETVPRDYLMTLRYRHNGSFALAGNYFRLMLQQQARGLWVDADMVCLTPFPDEDHLYGWETASSINNAVLRLPADSPIVAQALRSFTRGYIAPWIGFNRKRQLWMKRLAGIDFGPQDQRWGVLGPEALTWLARRHGALGMAKPIDVFYPVPFDDLLAPFAPGSSFDAYVSERTLGVHLWNSGIGNFQTQRPASGSAVGRLLTRHGV